MMIWFNSWYVGGGGGRVRRCSLCLRESVHFWLAPCHCKSVYSAQFGIKHNRLLSPGCCLCCPIKMEFIAALRASPGPTFLFFFSLPSQTHIFSPGGVGAGRFLFAPPVAAVRQVIRMAHYRPKQRHDVTGVPTYLSAHHRSCAAYISSHQSPQHKQKVELVHCPAHLDDRNH